VVHDLLREQQAKGRGTRWIWSLMRSGVVGAAIAVTAMLTAACSSSSESTTEPDPSSAPTSTAAEAAAMRGAPKIGTCWNKPPESFTPSAGYFNDSPAVACTKPHTTETVFVQELTEPTVQAAKEWEDQCGREATEYIGSIKKSYWVPVSGIIWLPPKEQVAAGASWVRCDVGFPRDWADVLPEAFDGNWEQTVRTFSAKDAVIEHPNDVLACLQRDPQIFNQWLVSCSKPHLYEETGQFAKLEALDSYPPPNQLQHAAAQCRDGLPAQQQTPAFGITAGWQPPDAFPGYITELVGVCFVYRQDGTPLPPRT
jgi:hypothetical protein